MTSEDLSWGEAQGLVGCQEGQIQGVDPDHSETPGSNLPCHAHQLDLAVKIKVKVLC